MGTIGFWGAVKLLIKYLPEIIELLKSVAEMIASGATALQVRSRIKGVTNAFKEKDPAVSARMLNDIFRK